MNKYDKYRECLQEEIDEMMEHKLKDMKSLEYLHCLLDMTKHLWERSKKYDEMVASGEIKSVEEHQHDIEKDAWTDKVPDSHIDERMHGMMQHFKMYKDYKTMYRKTGKKEDKDKMLESLGNIIKEHQLIVEEIMSCGLDCQEEKMYIKEFLQKTYRAVS